MMLSGRTVWAQEKACGYAGGVRVHVLYFGILKDRFGVAEEWIDVEAGARAGALVSVLRQRSSNLDAGPNAAPDAIWKTIAVAVNREYAGLETELHEGDEVALLPPVSGGV
jgi:molybdopterin converting factor subunit 1